MLATFRNKLQGKHSFRDEQRPSPLISVGSKNLSSSVVSLEKQPSRPRKAKEAPKPPEGPKTRNEVKRSASNNGNRQAQGRREICYSIIYY